MSSTEKTIDKEKVKETLDNMLDNYGLTEEDELCLVGPIDKYIHLHSSMVGEVIFKTKDENTNYIFDANRYYLPTNVSEYGPNCSTMTLKDMGTVHSFIKNAITLSVSLQLVLKNTEMYAMRKYAVKYLDLIRLVDNFNYSKKSIKGLFKVLNNNSKSRIVNFKGKHYDSEAVLLYIQEYNYVFTKNR